MDAASLRTLLKEITEETTDLLSSSFNIEVITTESVPDFDDPSLTFEDFSSRTKKCKLIETCVLYVDMRDSTQISASKQPRTLSRIYSAFVRSMTKAAGHFGGHIRGIVGDRIMVVFDTAECFKGAVNTAILMNTVATQVLAPRVQGRKLRCGIGVDHGKMLVTKAGLVKRGSHSEFYRGLVWLGKPANWASKLTDVANKTIWWTEGRACEGYHYPLTDKWHWSDVPYEQFLSHLTPDYQGNLRHSKEYFASVFSTTKTNSVSYAPVLVTKRVLDGFRAESPDDKSLTHGWWEKQPSVKGVATDVFGGAITFKAAYGI